MSKPTKGRKRRPPTAPSPPPAESSPPALGPVVGLGASAGGLDAFQKFFGNLRDDTGMAFVVVQHLDPRHATLLPELLGKATSMRVEQAKDRTPLAPNQVFVIPPNATLTVEGGVLRVTPPIESRGFTTPIDKLFRSLAEDQGQNAVCILLSGSGSDGTLGLRAVKEHGGMTMAQSPETAQHDGIPRSAISTGLVDYALPPEQLATKLMEYAAYLRGLVVPPGQEPPLEAGSEELRRICAHLLHRTGHDFTHYKPATLLRRVRRRMQVLQATSAADYLDRLRSDPKEAELLFRDLLIGVTQFFRDPDAFAVLNSVVVPRLVDLAGADGSLRVWIPGCATGEEVYSVAILLSEEAVRREVRIKIQIFAGDIDEEALEFARQARYPAGIADHVMPQHLERYFVRQDHTFQVAKELREMCIFSTHNLIKDPPFSRIDLIVCRNLLIYLDAEVQKHVCNVFHYALHRGGYLFLGPSESLAGPPELFRTVERKHRIFQRGETVTRQGAPLPVGLGAPGASGAGRVALRPGPTGVPELVTRLERLLIDDYAPVWAVINSRAEALYFSPRIGRYLEPAPGAPSIDVVDMAKRGLRLDLRTAIHKAVRMGETVVHEDIAVEVDKQVQRIRLHVRPITDDGAGGGGSETRAAWEEGGLFLVVFQELGLPQSPDEAAAAGTAPQTGDAMVQQLEAELRATKEHLQASVEEVETSNEELKSSNEELLSTNEELQSSNEELQTSKEELQSVNEELETINTELNSKVEQLDRANADLENLFQATKIPTLFLDSRLHISRFTEAAVQVYRLISTDVGRPIADIAPRFMGNLLEHMHEALATRTPQDHPVRVVETGADFIARVIPYRRTDKVVDGLVVTFLDVTQLELAQVQRRQLAAIVDSAHDAIFSRTLDGMITSWNDAATRLFGFTQDEAVGSPLSLIVPDDRVAELRQVEDQLQRGERVVPFESVRKTKDGRSVAVWLAVSPIKDSRGKLVGTSAICHDLTDLKHAQDLRAEAQRKDQFLAALSHELRSPLAALRISVDILQARQAPPKDVEGAIDVADRQLEVLTALVDQLLDTARIASGKALLKKIDEDLVEIVRTSVSDQKPQIERAGVRLTVDLPDAPLWVRCDPVRLSQVVANLLGNAAKFTQEGGEATITLRADRDANEAVLKVKDNGIGMNADTLASAFEPFRTGQAVVRGGLAGGGLGLGLAVVRTLVEAHGGSVEAWSAGPGRGSEFTVRLPLVERAPASGEAGEAPPAAPVAAVPRRVLIVEDQWDTANTLRMLLELNGHTVKVAAEANAALAAARAFRPDVVVSDIRLPGGLSGYDIAKAIRGDPGTYGSPLLIAFSGFGNRTDKGQARAAGFDHHVTKAERSHELMSLLEGAVLDRK